MIIRASAVLLVTLVAPIVSSSPASADPHCDTVLQTDMAAHVTYVENYELASRGIAVSFEERRPSSWTSPVVVLNGATLTLSEWIAIQQAALDSLLENPLDLDRTIGPRKPDTIGDLIDYDRLNCQALDSRTVQFEYAAHWTMYFQDGSVFQYDEEGLARYQKRGGSWYATYVNANGTFG